MGNNEEKERESFFKLQIADKEYILRLVFGIQDAGICITDADGHYVEINEAYCRIHGYRRDELMGRPFTMILQQDNRESAIKLYESFLVGMPEIPLEWNGRGKRGDVVTVLMNPGHLVSKDGKKYAMTSMIDITGKKRSKDLLVHYGNILTELYKEIYVFAADTMKFVHVNREGLQVSGYEMEELLEMAPLQLWPELTQSSLKSLTKMMELEEKDLMVYETMQRRKDGTKFEVEIYLKMLRNHKPPLYVAIVHDVMENKRLLKSRQELVVARNIRDNLIPAAQIVIPGYDIKGTILSSPTMGGDFYDIIQVDDRYTAFCVGDVTGRGIPAALLMSGLHTMVRGQVYLAGGAAEILRFSNIMLFRYAGTDKFAKLFYAILDREKNSLAYANAGFQRPVLFRAGEEPQFLEKGGYALGLKQDSLYSERELPLKVGDVLVVFSDGVIEAAGKKGIEFGIQGLGDVVLEVLDKPAIEIVEEILRIVVKHIGPINVSDDITLLVLKRSV